MNDVYTPKQLALMRLWQHGKLQRINVLSGSVRSGKTWISLVLWAFWVASMPKEGSYLMCAKTLTSLRRNCLNLLEELVGAANFTYSISRKEAVLFGRHIHLEGVNDVRAECKIRGMTLQGAYCDELTLFTEDFFAMLLSRLSEPKAKLIATTNPDSPSHWLKKKYLDRAGDIDLMRMDFLIDDNTKLDPGYVAEIKRENTGVFYDRFILGQWVVAEGLIYPAQAQGQGIVPTEPRLYTRYVVSVDYGTKNPFSAGLWGSCGGIWYRVRELYYDGRKTQRQLTDGEYYARLVDFIDRLPVERVVVDPSAASFIAEIRKHGRYSVRKARNDVLDGIRFTASAFAQGKIAVNDCCINTLAEFRAYRWDEKAAGDKPIKENDHAMDDLRYFCYTILKNEAVPGVVQLRR